MCVCAASAPGRRCLVDQRRDDAARLLADELDADVETIADGLPAPAHDDQDPRRHVVLADRDQRAGRHRAHRCGFSVQAAPGLAAIANLPHQARHDRLGKSLRGNRELAIGSRHRSRLDDPALDRDRDLLDFRRDRRVEQHVAALFVAQHPRDVAEPDDRLDDDGNRLALAAPADARRLRREDRAELAQHPEPAAAAHHRRGTAFAARAVAPRGDIGVDALQQRIRIEKEAPQSTGSGDPDESLGTVEVDDEMVGRTIARARRPDRFQRQLFVAGGQPLVDPERVERRKSGPRS